MLCDCADGVMSTKVCGSMIHKLVLFLKKHEKDFYMSHQYVLIMCTLLCCISPLGHTQARPAELIFLAITRFNWWNRTKSTSSATTEQLCLPWRGTKTGKKHEETEIFIKKKENQHKIGDKEDVQRILTFSLPPLWNLFGGLSN